MSQCFRQDLRHSSVTYERTPANFCIVYGIQDANNDNRWLLPVEIEKETQRCGLAMVPVLYQNDDEKVSPFDKADELLAKLENGELLSVLVRTLCFITLDSTC